MSDSALPTITGLADAQALAAAFLARRKAWAGGLELRMDATDSAGSDDTADDGAAADGQSGDGNDDDGDGADALRDAGKKALDTMKAQRNAFRDELRAFKALGLTVDQIKALQQGGKTGDEGTPDADAIRREVETAAAKKAAHRVLRSEIKAAAAGKLADPADAYRFLDLEKFEVDDDGNVDEDEIAEAITDLIKTKPYLAAAQGGGRRFQGGGDGGARNGAGPSQLTAADLDRMSPEQIVAARKEGRLNRLLGIPT